MGLFKIDAGECTAAGVTSGSSFRMINPGGKLGEGPFISNGDSPCGDKTYSPMFPGSDGGMRTGAYQPEVSPPFDGGGNGATESIAKGTPFFAVRFAVATNQKDPRPGATPRSRPWRSKTGSCRGTCRHTQRPGTTSPSTRGLRSPTVHCRGYAAPTGTYDEATKKFTLEWSSQIVGGAFNNFTGVWHFEGTFEPKS